MLVDPLLIKFLDIFARPYILFSLCYVILKCKKIILTSEQYMRITYLLVKMHNSYLT